MHDDDTPIETSEREARPWSPEMQATVAGRELSVEAILEQFVELLITGQDSGNLLADAQTALAVLIEGLLEKREAPCVPANAIEGITGPHNACMFREHCRAMLAAPQPAQVAPAGYDGMGIPLACGGPLCRTDEHHPLCKLAAPSAQAAQAAYVPLSVLEDASRALGNFVSDHGWSDSDMQAMDNLDAFIARHKAEQGGK